MGVVLFECLSGDMPYQAETITQLIAKMFTEAPRDLMSVAPHIPEAIANVVNTCLEQDRARRFQTARGLLGALEAAAGASAQASANAAFAPTGLGPAVSARPALHAAGASCVRARTGLRISRRGCRCRQVR